MDRVVREQKLRALLLLLMVLLGLGLTVHLVGEHAALAGGCLGVLVVVLALAVPEGDSGSQVRRTAPVVTRMPVVLVPVPVRHPPDEGIRLRL